MKKQFLRKTTLLLAIVIICVTTNMAVYSSSITDSTSYKEALSRLTSLGIVNGNGDFKPDNILTREQFCKMIVTAAGLEDTANSLKGSTIFSDVPVGSWATGYINTAINKGYITGKADGKFHPTDGVTFAQICTTLVKALGYTDSDLTGQWPLKYITKASSLGLTTGITLASTANVPRWAAAVMIDKLLSTNIKSTGASEQTFLEATGQFTLCMILGDSNTISSLDKGQVLTDKGVFSNSTGSSLVIGSKSYLYVKNNKILKASAQSGTSFNVTVDQVTDNKINYKNGTSNGSMELPTSITYYYNGEKQEYSKVAALLQKNTSIVFNYDKNNTVYESAVIFDPVYSKPEIANNFLPSTRRLGSISFSGDPLILKDGDSIDITQIVNRDVVYQVTDIWGGSKYIEVVDNKVGGKITDIQPNRFSPKTLQIDDVDYSFSKDFDFSKFASSTSSSFAVNYSIVVSLGIDGKIVNIENFGTEDNTGYAVVLDVGYTLTTNTNGTKYYTYSAKLLFSDGVTSTYNVKTNAYEFKGRLVQYNFVDDQTLSLEAVPYNFPNYTTIKKDERMLDDTYVADNVKIINIAYNDSNSAIEASVLNWNQLPNGTIPSGKIWYTNTAGAFNDINFILTDDILGDRYKAGVIKKVSIVSSGKGSSNSYTIYIDGKEYTYTTYIEGTEIGSVYEFKMSSSGIDSMVQSIYATSGKTVQAVDARRLKMNDTVYYLKSNVSVYYKDTEGNLTLKTLADINTAQTYAKVALYPDPTAGTDGKIQAIVLYE